MPSLTIGRRVRGLLGSAAVWGGTWGAIGALLGTLEFALIPGGSTLAASIFGGAWRLASLGAGSGVLFGALLPLGGRGDVRQITPLRAGLLGAIAASAYPAYVILNVAGFSHVPPQALAWILAPPLLMGGAVGSGMLIVARKSLPPGVRRSLADSPASDTSAGPGDEADAPEFEG